MLPRGPTLFSDVRADAASAPATRARASPVAPACDSRAALSSAAATTPLADSRTPASLRRPSRSARRSFGRPAASRSLLVIQARSADGQCRRHQRRRVALRDHLSRLGMNRTTAHSPTTFLGFRSPAPSAPACVPTAGCDGPSRFPRRQRFSPKRSFAPCSASSFQR